MPIQACLDLRQALLHLGRCEVLVTVVDCFEFNAVNDDQCLGKEVETPAQDNKLAIFFIGNNDISKHAAVVG